MIGYGKGKEEIKTASFTEQVKAKERVHSVMNPERQRKEIESKVLYYFCYFSCVILYLAKGINPPIKLMLYIERRVQWYTYFECTVFF